MPLLKLQEGACPMTIFENLPGALLPWYEQNRRQLPWRENRDPYRIWISEIMLQQTRVEAVKGYYARFLAACPDVKSLASAPDEQLHKLWEGLGYYSRVRNLKKAAQVVMEEHDGQFPKEYEKILALPGIGEYTAGAICSIAWDMPTPAVDGNVLRVISRLTDDATPIDDPKYKKSVRQRLEAIYPDRAGDFTQGLMELGATICGPNRKPQCDLCPCAAFCLGYQRGTAENLPVKAPKKKRRTEDMTVFVLCCDGKYALRKRGDTGLLAGLWEFPHCPGRLETADALREVENFGLKPKEIHKVVEKNHIFTHIEWVMRGVYVEVDRENEAFTWLSLEEIQTQAALPTAFRQFIMHPM